ncbi:unnamed protein product [Echinostoma caproni]|uniref:Cyclic nucleotide-binding domain-containing protein n=1 Tax=Echinostoma caproni TaxID=27848 RepID=A0A183A362_9TREM|nr:unnamed protein product [Echinostoma caproni]
MTRSESVSVSVSDNAVGYVCSNMFRCTETCRPLTVNRILSAAEKRSRYLRRLFNVKHMDFEHAIWEMVQLLVSPQKLFRNFRYRSRRHFDFPDYLLVLRASSYLFLTAFYFPAYTQLQSRNMREVVRTLSSLGMTLN